MPATTTRTTPPLAKPCPICGYDLRATPFTPSARCPECGTTFPGPIPSSQIPWVHRQHHGRIKAFLKTITFILLHPKKLAAEVHNPLQYSDAQKFHRICVAITALLLTLGFAFINYWMTGHGSYLHMSSWAAPIEILQDRWWALLPWLIGNAIGLSLASGAYRWFICVATLPRAKRRLRCLTLYCSAFLPLLTPSVLYAIWEIYAYQLDHGWFEDWHSWVAVGTGIPLAVLLWFSVPTCAVISTTGRYRIIRAAMFFLIHVPMLAVLFVGSLFLTLWVTGFAAIVVHSLMN